MDVDLQAVIIDQKGVCGTEFVPGMSEMFLILTSDLRYPQITFVFKCGDVQCQSILNEVIIDAVYYNNMKALRLRDTAFSPDVKNWPAFLDQ